MTHRIHNSLLQLAPVNTLPPEIMTQIFQLVLASEPCNIAWIGHADPEIEDETKLSISNDPTRTKNFPMYPDYLAQVCTRWRQVALSSPSLWSHIDFVPSGCLHEGMLDRAKVCAERAKSSSLILHVHQCRNIGYDKGELGRFLASIARRTKSLDLSICNHWDDFTAIFLGAFLNGCASDSAQFTDLTVDFHGYGYNPHFRSGEGDLEYHYYGGLLLPLPEWVIEDSLRDLSVLHLRGLFPVWSSAAYNDLVDLRLIASCNSSWHRISESAFLGILRASTRLRILHFALEIVSKKPHDSPMTPVYLQDLEILNIATYRGDEHESVLEPGDVLRMLAPGSKSLQLSVWHVHAGYDPIALSFSATELWNFFGRSNVTKFYIKGWCLPLGDLLSYAPNLQILALDTDTFNSGPVKAPTGAASSVSQLNTLVLYCWNSHWLYTLDLFLQYHPIESIIFLDSTLSPLWDEEPVWGKYPNTRAFLHESGNQRPDPLGEWDVFSIDYSKIVHSRD